MALIGQTVAQQLIGDLDPIDQTLRVRKGQNSMGQDQDDLIVVPLSTYRNRMQSGNPGRLRRVGGINVKVWDGQSMQQAQENIRELLRQRHRLQSGQDDDFSIRKLTEILQAQEASSRVMTLLLAAVAGVSLVVGGIGIMNIMLVSVTERTREIGLRMAVGARGRDILAQFLIEAVSLSLVGGAVGVVLGGPPGRWRRWRSVLPARWGCSSGSIRRGVPPRCCRSRRCATSRVNCMHVTKAFKGARRQALGSLAVLLLLAGCSSLPFNNPFVPRTIEVSQEQLLAQMSGQFPFNRRMLDFFEVMVSTPRLKMLPQENRMATELDVDTGRTLLAEGFKGRLALSYGLRYEPGDQSVRLADVRLERFQMDGVPDALKTRTGRLGSLLAEELLSGLTVYRFKAEDLNKALALGLKPGAIHVTGRGLALTLEPAEKR